MKAVGIMKHGGPEALEVLEYLRLMQDRDKLELGIMPLL